jgi:hypothetical protein
MEDEGVNPSHSPGVLGSSWTMTGTPSCHASVVDGTESTQRHTSSLRNLGESLCIRIFGVEARRVARTTSLNAFVRLPGVYAFGFFQDILVRRVADRFRSAF